jgi:hypothetical protein
VLGRGRIPGADAPGYVENGPWPKKLRVLCPFWGHFVRGRWPFEVFAKGDIFQISPKRIAHQMRFHTDLKTLGTPLETSSFGDALLVILYRLQRSLGG